MTNELLVLSPRFIRRFWGFFCLQVLGMKTKKEIPLATQLLLFFVLFFVGGGAHLITHHHLPLFLKTCFGFLYLLY